MVKRKAQFYIIGAVVIVVVLASLITIVNYIRTQPEPVKFYDLSNQLSYETSNIINYGIVNNEEDINKTINNFIKNDFLPYVKQKDPDIELIYIYGNSSSLTLVNYGKEAIIAENKSIFGGGGNTNSTISIEIGGERAEKTIVQASKYFQPFTMLLKPSRTVTLLVNNKPYTFVLTGKEQFFAIMTAKKEGDVYVTQTSG